MKIDERCCKCGKGYEKHSGRLVVVFCENCRGKKCPECKLLKVGGFGLKISQNASLTCSACKKNQLRRMVAINAWVCEKCLLTGNSSKNSCVCCFEKEKCSLCKKKCQLITYCKECSQKQFGIEPAKWKKQNYGKGVIMIVFCLVLWFLVLIMIWLLINRKSRNRD